MNDQSKLVVETTVHAPIEKVWEFWTKPDHVINWNNASHDWYTPNAENDLRKGGSFKFRMEAKDGSAGFDFEGVYDEVVPNEKISYTMGDGRKVDVIFEVKDDGVSIREIFDPEHENPLEMQQQGWQAILDNFKKYTESL